MAYINGKTGKLKVGATPSLVGEVTSISYTEETDEIEVEAMNQDTRYTGASVKGSGSASCNFDPADTNGQRAMIAALNNLTDQSIDLEYYPGGDTGTYSYYTGTPTILKVDITQDTKSVVSATFTFRGKLTLTDVP